jgi:omega-6 fatty acid desaturase (delta-12 desaturase)
MTAPNLKLELQPFRSAIVSISLFQLGTSLGGYFAACTAIYLLLPISVWLALPLLPLAAGMLVRIFIIQHDCGHHSFFRSRRANDALGMVCSVLTLTPYASWRRQHAGHHGVWNNLASRQRGADIYSSCLTVAEYRGMSPWKKARFRITRHPLVTNILLPPLIFLIVYRFPFDMPRHWRRERRSVKLTTLAVVCALGIAGFVVGYDRLLIVQLPILVIASIIGVWLFSVQHRGERIVWAEGVDWNPTTASLESATYLRLPSVLRWFTGNIGFHHVHHLEPRVPNYRLRECHNAIPRLQEAPAISFRKAFASMRLQLWDRERQVMTPVPK